MKKILLIAAVAFSLSAEDIYTGQTWEFAEENFLDAIQDHIHNNKDMINQKIEAFRGSMKERAANFKPKGVENLPRAKEDRVFYPDMIYVNEQDIIDHRGVMLYPKGYAFNPLRYIHLPYSIAVVDGTDQEQLQWLVDQNMTDNLRYKILITDGKFGEISKQLGQAVFFYTKEVHERFQLKAVPSLIYQKGESLEVQEICLDCNATAESE